MEFEHLPNDAVHADAQVLDGATEDQAQALDQSRALDSQPDSFLKISARGF
jgi:midasin (ATPase involved in ribosome maturation)